MPYHLQTGFLRIIGDGLSLSKPTIGLIMLGAMLFVIFIGFPISFTLIFLAFVFGIWGSNFKLTTLLMTLNTNSTMLNDQLMAVPLFILMGIVMEAAGLMERLICVNPDDYVAHTGLAVHSCSDCFYNICRRYWHCWRFSYPSRYYGWCNNDPFRL